MKEYFDSQESGSGTIISFANRGAIPERPFISTDQEALNAGHYLEACVEYLLTGKDNRKDFITTEKIPDGVLEALSISQPEFEMGDGIVKIPLKDGGFKTKLQFNQDGSEKKPSKAFYDVFVPAWSNKINHERVISTTLRDAAWQVANDIIDSPIPAFDGMTLAEVKDFADFNFQVPHFCTYDLGEGLTIDLKALSDLEITFKESGITYGCEFKFYASNKIFRDRFVYEYAWVQPVQYRLVYETEKHEPMGDDYIIFAGFKENLGTRESPHYQSCVSMIDPAFEALYEIRKIYRRFAEWRDSGFKVNRKLPPQKISPFVRL